MCHYTVIRQERLHRNFLESQYRNCTVSPTRPRAIYIAINGIDNKPCLGIWRCFGTFFCPFLLIKAERHTHNELKHLNPVPYRYQLMESHISSIHLALEDVTRPPAFIQGTWTLSPKELDIGYYDKNAGDSLKPFSFVRENGQPTGENDKLRLLYDACDAATFGRNNEDVLDESYRKAGKLDCDKFFTRIDSQHACNAARKLLVNNLNDGDVRAELYKLNVYGAHLRFFLFL